MNQKEATPEAHQLDPATLKKAELYQLIEELVLSEFARSQADGQNEASGNESEIIEDPAGHGR